MPSRNTIKQYAPYSYYHVYNRGVAKQPIFIDAKDKDHFLKILKRHLDPADASIKADGVPYRKFDTELDLLCYCLMGNHFHLLVYTLVSGQTLETFMRSILTAYTMYFNKKHKRVGTLFQGVYKASRINNESYLLHISRYIHLNPRRYQTYRYSSLFFYREGTSVSWLKANRVLEMGTFTYADYLDFLADYDDHLSKLEEIQYELADTKVARFYTVKGETL